jgi:hypothetical protein
MRDMFSSLLVENNEKQASVFQGMVTASVQKAVAPVLQRMDGIEQRATNTDNQIRELREAVSMQSSASAAATESLQRSVSATRFPTPSPNMPAPAPGKDDFFERSPDLSILVVGTDGDRQVSLESAKAGAAALCNVAAVPADMCIVTSVKGTPIDSKFIFKFGNGDVTTGKAQRDKAKLALKQPDGTFENLYFEAPDKSQVKVYLNPDRNGRNIRTRVLARKLMDAVKQVHPEATFRRGCKWFMDQDSGHMSYKHVPLAYFDIKDRATIKLEWNNPAVARFSVSKEEIKAVFNAATENATDIQWGS